MIDQLRPACAPSSVSSSNRMRSSCCGTPHSLSWYGSIHSSFAQVQRWTEPASVAADGMQQLLLLTQDIAAGAFDTVQRHAVPIHRRHRPRDGYTHSRNSTSGDLDFLLGGQVSRLYARGHGSIAPRQRDRCIDAYTRLAALHRRHDRFVLLIPAQHLHISAAIGDGPPFEFHDV